MNLAELRDERFWKTEAAKKERRQEAEAYAAKEGIELPQGLPRGGGSYEDAPATRMLATHCACCGRPLVDAVSVEAGMGPECRRRHFVGAPVDEATRKEANKLIYEIALKQDGFGIAEPLDKLRALGFDRLVKRIEQRAVPIHIEEREGRLIVKTPYRKDSLAAWRAIPGRIWDKEAKVNTVPAGQRHSLCSLLKRFYKGELAAGPKGTFEVK